MDGCQLISVAGAIESGENDRSRGVLHGEFGVVQARHLVSGFDLAAHDARSEGPFSRVGGHRKATQVEADEVIAAELVENF